MTASVHPTHSAAFSVLAVAMLLAAVVPMQIAYSMPPSGTFFNQAAAMLLWGVVVAALALRCAPRLRARLDAAAPLFAALVLLGVAALSSWRFGRLPASLAISALGVIAAGGVMVASGAIARGQADGRRVLEAFFGAWVVAGVLTALVCLVQTFTPGWTDGTFIALASADGRAIGNLRQPNQVSSQLLWAAVAVIPLLHRGLLRRGPAFALFALMMCGVVLTGSRTGMMGVLGLTAWGMLDKRLARSSGVLLSTSILWFGLFWLLASTWASATGHVFGSAERIAAAGLASSRFALWSNTASMIAADPLAGIGFGQFNFAWTLTPFAERSGEFFDHTHNIVMQLAVELGLPLAGLALGMLGWALWRAGRNCVAEHGGCTVGLRAAFAMVLIMALHSQLEYPLWFAFFLLPTAWAWGFVLGPPAATAPSSSTGTRRPLWLVIAGLSMALAAALALADFAKVTRIYAADSVEPLAARIACGQRSWLFAHHADYAAAVSATGPAEAAMPLRRAMHFMLDDQLMVVLTRILALQGEIDRARHVAQRLREFAGSRATEFIADCEAGKIQPPTFRCEAPARTLGWHDFR